MKKVNKLLTAALAAVIFGSVSALAATAAEENASSARSAEGGGESSDVTSNYLTLIMSGGTAVIEFIDIGGQPTSYLNVGGDGSFAVPVGCSGSITINREGEVITSVKIGSSTEKRDCVKVNDTEYSFTVQDGDTEFEVLFASDATYAISCLSVKGIGHYTASTNKATPGTEITVEIETLAGYTLEKITYKNKTTNDIIEITGGKFTMPASDVEIIPVLTASPKYKATAVSKTFPAGFTDPDRKAAAEKITNKISKVEVKNDKVVVTFNDTYANIKKIMDGDDLLKQASPTGVDPIYLDITTDIPGTFDSNDFSWKTGYGWNSATHSDNFDNSHIMLWLNPANSSKTITYTVGSEMVQTLVIEYNYKTTTSGSTGSGSSSTRPSSTNNTTTTPARNPDTGIALVAAPAALAAAVVIVAAKKKK